MSDARYSTPGLTAPFTPAADTSAGTIVVLGEMIGVCQTFVAAGQLGSLGIEGVWLVNKAAGEIAAGAPVFWDPATKTASSSNGGDAVRLGVAVETATANAETVAVKFGR